MRRSVVVFIVLVMALSMMALPVQAAKEPPTANWTNGLFLGQPEVGKCRFSSSVNYSRFTGPAKEVVLIRKTFNGSGDGTEWVVPVKGKPNWSAQHEVIMDDGDTATWAVELRNKGMTTYREDGAFTSTCNSPLP